MKERKDFKKPSPQELQAGKPHNHTKYKKPVALVYGEVDGVYFSQSFKSLTRATNVAKETNGTLILL